MKDLVTNDPRFKVGNIVTWYRKSTLEEEELFNHGLVGGCTRTIGQNFEILKNFYEGKHINLLYVDGWWHSILDFLPKKEYLRLKKRYMKISKWKSVWKGEI